MADKQIGFVRVDEETHAWLTRTAKEAGIPISSAARAIITQAMHDGWIIEKAAPYRIRATRPAPPPVADPFGGVGKAIRTLCPRCPGSVQLLMTKDGPYCPDCGWYES